MPNVFACAFRIVIMAMRISCVSKLTRSCGRRPRASRGRLEPRKRGRPFKWRGQPPNVQTERQLLAPLAAIEVCQAARDPWGLVEQRIARLFINKTIRYRFVLVKDRIVSNCKLEPCQLEGTVSGRVAALAFGPALSRAGPVARQRQPGTAGSRPLIRCYGGLPCRSGCRTSPFDECGPPPC